MFYHYSANRIMDPDTSYFDIRPEPAAAIAAGHPVVALESTVVAHGLPFPTNLETAAAMESAVRAAGAIPATVAILDGRIVVGLSPAELERIGDGKHEVAKVSRRDFGPVLASRAAGATTVAATMIVAQGCGIRFFATGGIGGVHRGAQHSFDISADLVELGATPVGVVCAGPKAVLDIPLTLEILETAGAPLVGYRTPEMPAFYSTGSGFTLEHYAPDAHAMARIAHAHWGLGLRAGILITNPPPAAHAIPRDKVESWIAEALAAAENDHVTGKAVTPFLLSQLASLSAGRTLTVNQALLVNNATAAAEIAVAYASLDRALERA